MDIILKKYDTERLKENYRPYYLAVDEFAIHKGHSYATCIIDLARGEVIWVGKGRAIKDFTEFFKHFEETDYLLQVKAVAMDMNASYNRLVEEYLPDAQIVYDRYHFQAQFGKDMLGQVRLAEAKKHKKTQKTFGITSFKGRNEERKTTICAGKTGKVCIVIQYGKAVRQKDGKPL